MHADSKSALTDVTVVILIHNEELNIAQALKSVAGWARQIFILDSYSTDRTSEIATAYPCTIVQNGFENYATQRNFALHHLPIHSEWVLFLDADEWIPNDLKQEITALIGSTPEENGFYIKYRMMWGGQWIRRGY